MKMIARLARSLRRRRANSLRARMDALEAQYQSAWGQHLPAFLNAVSSVGALGFEVSQQRHVTDRQKALLEALVQRLNLASELQPGQDGGTGRILNPEKIAAARPGALRLHIGGQAPLADYINVDEQERAGIDILADAAALPLAENSAREIFSPHLLQRFGEAHIRHRILPHWKTILAPGGVLHLVVPDSEALFSTLSRGDYAYADFRAALLAGHADGADLNLFTPQSLTTLLQEAGFTAIDTPVRARRNGPGFAFEIRATRP